MPPEPCPNESGECSPPAWVTSCEATEASLWYGKRGAKYCKGCYDKRPNKKRVFQALPAEPMDQEVAGDELVRIVKICGTRPPALKPARPSLLARPNLTTLTEYACAGVRTGPGETFLYGLWSSACPSPRTTWSTRCKAGSRTRASRRASCMALGRRWIPAAQVALGHEWTEQEEEYDQLVLTQRRKFE